MNFILNQDTLGYIMKIKRVLIEELAYDIINKRLDLYAHDALWQIDQYLFKEKLMASKDLILNQESLTLDKLIEFLFEFENDIAIHENNYFVIDTDKKTNSWGFEN